MTWRLALDFIKFILNNNKIIIDFLIKQLELFIKNL